MLVDGAFFTVLTPYFRPGRMLNIGPTRLGVLVSMYPLGGLVYGLVALAASIAGLRFGSQEWLLDASRFFGGVGASCVWTGGLSVLLHSSPANVRGRAIAVAMSGSLVGSLVSPMIGASRSASGGPACSA